MYDYDKVIDQVAKDLASTKQRRHVSMSLGDRLKPEAKKQLLALRQQLADKRG